MAIRIATVKMLRNANNPGRRSFKNTVQLARVERVYDGDTINILTSLNSREPYYEYSLRILGIDAPELNPPLIVPNRETHIAAAKVARDRLKVLLPESSIICVDYKSEDKYGRLLGTIYDDELERYDMYLTRAMTKLLRNVGDQLLEEGFVNEYNGRQKTNFSLQKLEEILMLGKKYGL